MGPLGGAHRTSGARLRSPKPVRFSASRPRHSSRPAPDLLISKTFSDLNELRERFWRRAEAAGDDPVIVAQVTIDDFGNLASGATPEAFTREMNSWPADVSGSIGSVGPKTALEAIERMVWCRRSRFSAMPTRAFPRESKAATFILLAGIHGAVCAAPLLGRA